MKSVRFGLRSDPSEALTLDDVKRAVKNKKLDTVNTDLKNAPIGVILKEEKIEETVLKKPRGLTPNERAALIENKLKAWGPLYKSFLTGIENYVVSPRWDAVKSAHYSGFLGSTFAALTANIAHNAGAILQPISNFFNGIPYLDKVVPHFDNPPPLDNLPIEDMAHWGVAGALLVGLPTAVAQYFARQKENEDYEALLKLNPEGATKFNLLSDRRLRDMREDYASGQGDGNLERRFFNMFSPNTAVPTEFLPPQQGFAFPWNLLPVLTSPVRDLPVGNALHNTVSELQSNGITPALLPTARDVATGARDAGTGAYNLVKGTITTPAAALKRLAQDGVSVANTAKKGAKFVKDPVGNIKTAIRTWWTAP